MGITGVDRRRQKETESGEGVYREQTETLTKRQTLPTDRQTHRLENTEWTGGVCGWRGGGGGEGIFTEADRNKVRETVRPIVTLSAVCKFETQH